MYVCVLTCIRTDSCLPWLACRAQNLIPKQQLVQVILIHFNKGAHALERHDACEPTRATRSCSVAQPPMMMTMNTQERAHAAEGSGRATNWSGLDMLISCTVLSVRWLCSCSCWCWCLCVFDWCRMLARSLSSSSPSSSSSVAAAAASEATSNHGARSRPPVVSGSARHSSNELAND